MKKEAKSVTFQQLFNVDEIQKFQDDVAAALGVASIITQPDGTPITRPSRFCRLCAGIIRASEAGAENCRCSDAVIGTASTKGPTIQRCLSGGLWDAGATIIVGGQHIANWMVGQIRDESQDERGIREYARRIGVDENEAVAAFYEVSPMSKERFENVARMVFSLAAKLADSAYRNLQLTRSIEARAQVEEALRNREAFQRVLFSSSRTGQFVLDPVSLNFIDCNDVARGKHRIPGQGAIPPLTVADLSPPCQYDGRPSRDAFREYVDEALSTGSRVFSWRHRRLNGDEWDAEIHLRALRFQGSDYLQGEVYDITARKQAELTLQSIMGAAKDAIVVIDPKGSVTYWNRAAHQMLGYSESEIIGRNLHEFIVPGRYLSAHNAAFSVFQRTGEGSAIGKTLELAARRKDGSEITVEVSLASVELLGGWHAIGILRDITDRKKSEEKLRLAARVFSNANEGILIVSPDALVMDANEAVTAITGRRREAMIGKRSRILSSALHNGIPMSDLWHEIKRKGYWNGEILHRRTDGTRYAAQLTINAVSDDDGAVSHYLIIFSDITKLKQQQEQLETLAHYDALTSLPNRTLIADRLRQAMLHATQRKKHVAVAYLDLDGFKAVNDAYGRGTGDQLLMAAASNMAATLREGDTLARIGGDEFVAVLQDLNGHHACLPLVQALLTATALPVKIGDITHSVSASIGVTFYPQEDEVDADQLLRQADQAMYQAKLAGKDRYHFFDPQHDRSVRGYYESLDQIREALEKKQFVLYYQPKVNMRTGELIGAEALIRWRHPEEGLLPPSVFLPAVETNALGIEIGEWVLDAALRQIKAWRDNGLTVPVSVNVGAHQLQQVNFVPRLKQILEAHPDVPRGNLTLEILETSALEDLAKAHHTIERCNEMGVMVALDDFGTGYSSLTYLKRLPVQEIKIDQSFVRGLLNDPDDLTILRGIIGLGTAFRRQIIAEGVETVAHGGILLRLGCELAQGYAIARPMPAEDLPSWAATWKPARAWSGL